VMMTTPPRASRPVTNTRPRKTTIMTPTRLHLHPKPCQIGRHPLTKTRYRKNQRKRPTTKTLPLRLRRRSRTSR
jgi:hypothetical protein